jgi:hypothetical protein
MHKIFHARATTGGGVVPDSLRRPAVVAGGVAAGLVVVGLAAYAFGTAKSTLSINALLSAPECETQPISIVLGQNAEATMTVSRRTRCQIATGLPMASIEEFSIIDPPKHGTVMQRGRAGVVYQSDGDFRGKDSFAFAMRGKSADTAEGAVGETSVVRAHVTVK